MRKLLFLLAFLFASGTAHANQSSPLTCWYNSSGAFTGADSGNPAGVPAAGQVQSYRTGDYAYAYRLDVWNNGNDCPRSINVNQSNSASVDWTLQPAFGYFKLRSGFQPDPVSVSVVAGGTISAAQAVRSDCLGLIAGPPDVDVYYDRQDGSTLPLIISSTSGSDTTLVINGPDGQWYCDDDGGVDLNPSIRFNNPTSGLYNVWVGTYGSQTANATLQISELRGY